MLAMLWPAWNTISKTLVANLFNKFEIFCFVLFLIMFWTFFNGFVVFMYRCCRPFFYVGACYVMKIFVLNHFLEHLECGIFINITPKASKCLILCEIMPWTNKLICKRSYPILKVGMCRHPPCLITFDNCTWPMKVNSTENNDTNQGSQCCVNSNGYKKVLNLGCKRRSLFAHALMSPGYSVTSMPVCISVLHWYEFYNHIKTSNTISTTILKKIITLT